VVARDLRRFFLFIALGVLLGAVGVLGACWALMLNLHNGRP
jgi:hypothetical protein